MAELLKHSADVIDGKIGTDEVGPLNRINFQLTELADDVAMVEAFSHSILFRTGEGLVVFDTSNLQGSNRVVEAIRDWSKDPFHSLVYTHGHMDHVGGCGTFLRDAQDRGHARPQIVGHENINLVLTATTPPTVTTWPLTSGSLVRWPGVATTSLAKKNASCLPVRQPRM